MGSSKVWRKGRWFWRCNQQSKAWVSWHDSWACNAVSRLTYSTEQEALNQGKKHRHQYEIHVQQLQGKRK